MARLIDADERITEIKKQYCTDCENYGGVKCRACWVDDAMCLIDDATTVDAVEVVRCRDCKWYMPGDLFTDIMFCHSRQNTITAQTISVPTENERTVTNCEKCRHH